MLLVLVGSFALLAGQPPNSERDLHCLSARRPPPELQNPLVQPGLQSQDGERDEQQRSGSLRERLPRCSLDKPDRLRHRIIHDIFL